MNKVEFSIRGSNLTSRIILHDIQLWLIINENLNCEFTVYS